MNPEKHTIKHLEGRMINPKLYATKIHKCVYLIQVSKLIRSTTGETPYTDNFYKCGKTDKRLPSRRRCMNCKMYTKPELENE